MTRTHPGSQHTRNSCSKARRRQPMKQFEAYSAIKLLIWASWSQIALNGRKAPSLARSGRGGPTTEKSITRLGWQNEGFPFTCRLISLLSIKQAREQLNRPAWSWVRARQSQPQLERVSPVAPLKRALRGHLNLFHKINRSTKSWCFMRPRPESAYQGFLSLRYITDTKNPCVLVLTRCHMLARA